MIASQDRRRFLIQRHHTTILVLILPVTKANRVSHLQSAPIKCLLFCGTSDFSLYPVDINGTERDRPALFVMPVLD
jgi:hypothetical protein